MSKQMHFQDCYVKYTNAETGAIVRSEHRVWDKELFVTSRDNAARNHNNEDERGKVEEISWSEFNAHKL